MDGTRFCGGCGREATPGDRFCRACGVPLGMAEGRRARPVATGGPAIRTSEGSAPPAPPAAGRPGASVPGWAALGEQVRATTASDLRTSAVAVAVGVVPVALAAAGVAAYLVSLASSDADVDRAGLIFRAPLLALSMGFGATARADLVTESWDGMGNAEATLGLPLTIVPFVVLLGLAAGARRLLRAGPGEPAAPAWWVAARTAGVLAVAVFVASLACSYSTTFADDDGRLTVDAAVGPWLPTVIAFVAGWATVWLSVAGLPGLRARAERARGAARPWVDAATVAGEAMAGVVAATAIGLTGLALVLSRTSLADEVELSFLQQAGVFALWLPTLVLWAAPAALGASVVVDGRSVISLFEDEEAGRTVETFGRFGTTAPPLWWSIVGLAVVGCGLYLVALRTVNRRGDDAMPVIVRGSVIAGTAWVVLSSVFAAHGTYRVSGAIDVFDASTEGSGLVRISLIGAFITMAAGLSIAGWLASRTSTAANELLRQVPGVGAWLGVGLRPPVVRPASGSGPVAPERPVGPGSQPAPSTVVRPQPAPAPETAVHPQPAPAPETVVGPQPAPAPETVVGPQPAPAPSTEVTSSGLEAPAGPPPPDAPAEGPEPRPAAPGRAPLPPPVEARRGGTAASPPPPPPGSRPVSSVPPPPPRR